MTEQATPQSRAPIVSVIVPTYKRSDWLPKAIESLIGQDLAADEFEVIVADSSPDTRNADIVKHWSTRAKCRLVYLRKQPEGPGPSRNLGAANARGEFLAFMDSDCYASPGWLRQGIRRFRDGVGIVQGRTLPDPAGRPGIFTWYLRVEKESFIYEAANIFFRRQAFEQVEGFQKDARPTALSPLGGEDLDLAWRIKRLGWQSTFADDAVVYHEIQPTSVGRWLYNPRNAVWPGLAKRFPEIRAFFFARYFFDRHQAWLSLGLVGVLLAPWFPVGLVLLIPYLLSRALEPTQSLAGLKRLARPFIYLPRDLATFVTLAVASIRARSILL